MHLKNAKQSLDLYMWNFGNMVKWFLAFSSALKRETALSIKASKDVQYPTSTNTYPAYIIIIEVLK